MTQFRYREMSSVMLGALIGEGAARKVFHCALNDKYVCKVEEKGRSFQNV
jgi:hypothetical protein